MSPGRRIKIYAECSPWCLWDVQGGVDLLLREDALPLSETLIERIKAWFNAYDDPRPDWPLWTPSADAIDVEHEWSEEAEALRELLAMELGPAYEVSVDL